MSKTWGFFWGVICFALCGFLIVSLQSKKLKNPNFDTDSPSTNTATSVVFPEVSLGNRNENAVTDSEDNLLEIDPLFSNDEAAEEEMAFIDPVGEEGRQFARITAHMSDQQLMKYRELRKGSIVRTVEGVLLPPYEISSDCGLEKTENECVPLIVNSKTKVVAFDGQWTSGFIVTGAGHEVVKEK